MAVSNSESSMKKKIIFFLSPEVTGAERVSVTMAKGLSKDEYDVVYAIIGNTFGSIISFIPYGSTCYLVPLLSLDEFMKREHPQEVFCSLIHLNGEVLKSAQRVGGIKTILRNNYKLSDVSEENLAIAKECYPEADEVIAQTEEMKTELMTVCDVKEKNIRVLDNPVDEDYINQCVNGVESPYPNDGKQHFCWVGRYDWIKGPDILVSYFADKHKNNKNISLYMVGMIDANNPVYQSVKCQIEELGLLQDVHVVGFDNNPYRWIKYSQGLIMSSRSEASSNVVKEANYLGIPVYLVNEI